MMIRKITMAAVLTAVGLVVTGPANAAAYLINGKWYYFSLEFITDIYKMTGKAVNDGTRVQAQVVITGSSTGCTNPQYQVIEGEGPTGPLDGSSPNVNDDNLIRADRQKGNVFNTTAGVPLIPEGMRLGVSGACKEPNGTSQWWQIYWRDRGCNKGGDTTYRDTCYDYSKLAVQPDPNKPAELYYLTGSNVLGSVVDDPTNFAWVFVPEAFVFHSNLENTTTGEKYGDIYGSCQFPVNPDTGVRYSFGHPPADGWAAKPIYYSCDFNLTKDQYDAIYNQYVN